MGGVIVRDGALASNRLDDRQATLDGEVRDGLLGKRVADAAARDEERLLGCFEERDGFLKLAFGSKKASG